MKQGVLVIAHKNFEQLKKLIEFFDDDFYLYIHLDKKSKFSKAEIEALQTTRNVSFLSKQLSVNWGGGSLLKAILLLSKEALKNESIEYFHLISGQDFPVKSCAYMKNYLIEHRGKDFLEHFELPAERWVYDGGLYRVLHFHFYDLFNARTTIGRIINKVLTKVQRTLKIKRSLRKNFPPLFGGSGWWTLSYSTLAYVVDYAAEKPDFLKRFKYTSCADEMYFQTIVMNSPLKQIVVNNNLRYIRWDQQFNDSPANLDETDYGDITRSAAFFARKLEYPVSKGLASRIEKHISGAHSGG